MKVERGCSEEKLAEIARQLSEGAREGDWFVLEGPMGAGKSTFARLLIGALGVAQAPEGSPSFAIAHEYWNGRFDVVHIDFYRLRSEREIDDAGIPAYFWERSAVVITEWLSSWPDFERRVLDERALSPATRKVIRVYLEFEDDSPSTRTVRLELPG